MSGRAWRYLASWTLFSHTQAGIAAIIGVAHKAMSMCRYILQNTDIESIGIVN